MNIFFVNRDPELAASCLADCHVRKMIIESAQILSTAHHILHNNKRVDYDRLYKKTHVNHPMNIWARECAGNYHWLYMHFFHLALEYEYRFHKIHATFAKTNQQLMLNPFDVSQIITPYQETRTLPPQCMPDKYRRNNPFEAYRLYYMSKKETMKVPMIWTKRNPPRWFKHA